MVSNWPPASDLVVDTSPLVVLGKVGRLDIPDALNTIADYPIAAVNDSATPELARAFIDFVRGSKGQMALSTYNFIPLDLPGDD